MRRVLTSGIFVVFCFLTVTILAQVPQLLNYQGRLTDDKGIPIITLTTVRFSLYQGGDAATPGSGTLVYQEDASVTPDDNGVFSHLIGSGTVIFGALDSTVFQTADPVYLEITVDPAGANETLLPRKQIVTVGYSFKAEVAELADDADMVDGEHASAFSPVMHNHDPDYVNEGQANSVNSAMIVNGTIVDADINAGANIAGSKIDPTGLDADLLDGKDSLAFVHTAGDDMTGTLNVNTATQYALYGATSNTSGYGVSGFVSATSGLTYGVYGESVSSNGHGVYGYASATTGINYGIYGISTSNSGYGVYGRASNLSGTNYGVYGINNSTSGRGVYGFASATTGTNYGVYGESASASGRGVYGQAPTYAVYGLATATSGTNYGVYGESASASGYAGYFQGNAHVTGDLTVGGGLDADLLDGKDSLEFVHTTGDDMTGTLNVVISTGGYAVYGSAPIHGIYGISTNTTGTNWGVCGEGVSPGAWGVFGTAPTYGVYGLATDPSGGNHGVYGETHSPNGQGVLGIAPNLGVWGHATATSGKTYGVSGLSDSTSGYGVYGRASATSGFTSGVYGTTASTYGLASGVSGFATATSGLASGVYGQSAGEGGFGVMGWAAHKSGANRGVWGRSDSTTGSGVYGFASAGSGINYGVYGTTNSSSGYAGYFAGNVHVTGTFKVDGPKACVQPIDNGKKVLLYAMESPEIWFEDFGTAQLVDGHAVVQIEQVFAQTANIEMGYLIFLTPVGECQGLYISRQDKDSFEVREQGGGTSSISFNYRIVAKRRGYEEVRFEEFTEPEQPPAEPNLPIEKK